jgi:uncharacterized protein (DUF427 family)
MEQNLQAEAKPIKIPGADHPISIEPNSGRVVVSVAGRVLADTREALTLYEAHYPAVQYIPRKDAAAAARSTSTASKRSATLGLIHWAFHPFEPRA